MDSSDLIGSLCPEMPIGIATTNENGINSLSFGRVKYSFHQFMDPISSMQGKFNEETKQVNS